jgi:hypothetical protein
MVFSRGFLALVGIVFVAFGVWGLIDPVAVCALSDVKLPTATALADGRAVYGGLTLGMGVFFLLAAARANLVRAGLWSAVLMVGGAGMGRVLGAVMDGAGRAIVPPMVAELLIALLAFIALWRIPDRRPGS